MLDELLAHHQVIEACRLDGIVGLMALHGGIEEGTAELAEEAAYLSGSSLYSVTVGDGLWWHVPSTQFDPQHSTKLTGFLDHVAVCLSIHGYGRKELGATVLLGGGNRDLAARARQAFVARTDLKVIDEIDAIPAGLRGLHPRNPVNAPRLGGVQVELPPSARNGTVAAGVVVALVEVAQEAARSLT